MREADLPAEQPEAQEEARVSDPDADTRGPGSAEDPPWPRPRPALGLIHRIRSRGTFSALAARPSRPVAVPSGCAASLLGAGPPQVGYAVGRPVGNAVTRNQLRRRLRSVMTAHEAELEAGTAYLVGAGTDATGASVRDPGRARGRVSCGADRDASSRPCRGAGMVMIRGYQRVMAGSTPRCRFAPTCSEYTRQAIEIHGLIRGAWQGARRISRCHPWHPGGHDPVVDPNISSVSGG